MAHCMAAGNNSEEASPFAFADEIFAYSDRLWKTLAYFVSLSIFLIVLVAWYAFDQPRLGGWDLLIFGYGFLVVIYFPVALWNGIRLVLPLRRWADDYFDFAFVVKFELFPARGATPTDSMLNKLAEVYPEVARLVERSPKAIRRNAGLRKKPRVTWDLVIDLKYPRLLRTPFIHSHWGTPSYLLVKRFDGPSLVTRETLQKLGEGLDRDLRWQGSDIYRIFVVTPTGFTAEATEAVREESIPDLSEFSLELIVETSKGYTLPIKD